jgi:N-acetylmuramoyl-L-alanine amidase/FlgD Ig-like domain
MRKALRILITGALLLSAPAVAGAADVRLASLPISGGAPVRAPFAFDLVGARWSGRGHIELRSRTPRGAWTAWSALAPGEDVRPGGGDSVAEPIWTGRGRIVQLRSSGPVRGLRAIFVNGGSGPAAGARLAPAGVATAPVIHTRAEWGADESMRRANPLYAASVQMVFVHHTATTNDYSESQVPAILRSIYTYHVQANGWNDIGYNYLVDRFGQIWEGRYGGITRNVVGAQTLGFNTGSVGIAYIGDGQSAALTDAARAALVSLISWRLDLAHVDPRSTTPMVSGGNPKYPAGTQVTLRAVSGHRDGTLTDCPGDTIYAQLPQIAEDAYASGLPKIFAPEASALTSYPVRFAAALSSTLSWTVRVLDAAGTTIASKSGTGSSVAWSWDGRSAAGAPVAPGVAASWSIDAQDAAGNRALPATGGLLGSAPPIVQGSTSAVTVAPSSISPDGDGQADAATVTFSVASPVAVTVTVQDSLGTVLSMVLPTTAVPAGPVSLSWAGAAADPGTTVPDGAYRMVVTTTDAAGVSTSASAPISIVRAAGALTGPLVSVSPNRDRRGDNATFRWTQLEPSHATLKIVSASAPLATVLDADLPVGPARGVWDGSSTSKLTSGSLGAVLTLTTEAGQQLLQTTFTVDLTPPGVRGLQARTRAGGGFVRFSLSEPGYVQLRVQGHLLGGYVKHRAGVVGIRYHLAGRRARRIELRLLDLAGNAGHARIVLRR